MQNSALGIRARPTAQLITLDFGLQRNLPHRDGDGLTIECIHVRRFAKGWQTQSRNRKAAAQVRPEPQCLHITNHSLQNFADNVLSSSYHAKQGNISTSVTRQKAAKVHARLDAVIA